MPIHNTKRVAAPVTPPPKRLPQSKKLPVPSVQQIKQAVERGPIKVTMSVPAPQAPAAAEKPKKRKPHPLDGKLLHVRVGDSSLDRDVLQAEIDKVENTINELFDANDVDCMVFVTHYAVELKLIEGGGRKEGTEAPL